MEDYKIVIPGSLEEGLKFLADNRGATVLAGGSELFVRIREGKDKPALLVDIANINLNYVRCTEREISIGAMVTLTEIIKNSTLSSSPYNIIKLSAVKVGAVQTRNVATIGGNICTGNSSADMAVALLALDARVKLLSVDGERIVPIDKFFIGPRKIDIKDNEIVTEIVISKPEGALSWGADFIKYGKRKANYIAVISAGAVLGMDNQGNIHHARLAMGTAAPTPIRLYHSEQELLGNLLSDEIMAATLTRAQGEINPRTSLRGTEEHRRSIARVILKRSIQKAAACALGREYCEG